MGSLNQLTNGRWSQHLKGFASDLWAKHLQRVGVSYVDVKLTAAQLDALNATPVELVPAPGSGKLIEVIGVFGFVDFVSAALELGSGTLDIRYENSSGGLAAQFTNAWVESAADAYFKAYGRDVIMLANKAIVAHASSDVTSGDSIIYLRVFFRTIVAAEVSPTVP